MWNIVKGQTTTTTATRHIAAASYTEGRSAGLCEADLTVSEAEQLKTPDDRSKHGTGKKTEMDSENASLTNTGNYTTSGMRLRCKTLEAIEN